MDETTFAEYLLEEKNITKKMEIMCYLHNKRDAFFDKSVILKAELARMFISTMNLDVDLNFTVTACLCYACKKNIKEHDADKIKKYAVEGADYLQKLGFSKRFCKICSEFNRYVNFETREKESDILELVDNFGGLVLDRPERKGFPIDVAMNVLANRNLKDINNIYLKEFQKFIYYKKDKREIDEVYKPNSDCNIDVEELIKVARKIQTKEDFIAYLSGAKEGVENKNV